MARPSDPNKRAAWRERFERFSRCGLGVAQFCARERVSEASFYRWRKRLRLNGRRLHKTEGRGVFQPITVLPAASDGVPRAAASEGGVPQTPTICIQLPCGTRIEVGTAALDAVRVGDAEAAWAGRGRKGSDGPC
jgi:hypothetical protein